MIDLEVVEKLLELLGNSEADKIEVRDGDTSIKVSRNSAGVAYQFAPPPAPPASAIELYAFVMANQHQQLDGEPEDYLASVDLVEALSGLDFFAALPDLLEDVLEQEPAASWPIR